MGRSSTALLANAGEERLITLKRTVVDGRPGLPKAILEQPYVIIMLDIANKIQPQVCEAKNNVETTKSETVGAEYSPYFDNLHDKIMTLIMLALVNLNKGHSC